MSAKNWFEVDKAGLAKLLERKGKEFILYELLQNAWDEPGVTRVEVDLQRLSNTKVALTVTDDAPDGFKDLKHAYTLFAESSKKTDPTKRGRFNLGEKLVLALASEATIATTTGTMFFNPKGRVWNARVKRPVGSSVTVVLPLTGAEFAHVRDSALRLQPPLHAVTFICGERLHPRMADYTFSAVLPTEQANGDGVLRKLERETVIDLLPLATGEVGTIYELGIPVCETGDKWHYNVNQKIPLTMDRDAVLPSYLRRVRAEVFNRHVNVLSPEETSQPWVADALESQNVTVEAVRSFANVKFGEKRVSFDPSDPEANKLAVSQGFQVVHGGAMSSNAWQHLRDAGAIQPAGKVTPSAKSWTGEDNPDAQVCPPIPRDKWTPCMAEVSEYAQHVARETMGAAISVSFYSSMQMLAAATYGPGRLSFNKLRLGGHWFDLKSNREAIDALLIHEFGHHYSFDHLSRDYYDALCKISAAFVRAVREGRL